MRTPNPALGVGDAIAAWDAARAAAAADAVTVQCTLATPMYGGGVTPGEVDRELPIRPGAIRGQLRFWWRLLYGADDDPGTVFSAESALWGGIATKGPRASQVAVHVRRESEAKRMVNGRSKDFPTYSLILERGDDPFLLKDGYKFTLTLRFSGAVTDVQRNQVIETLRWWASFGGVGARTRRGLGAVRASSNDVELKPVLSEEVESRSGWMLVGPAGSHAIEAWKNAVETLRDFRQRPNVGRNPGQGSRPGRSRWPEPDAIRRRTDQHARGHEPSHEAGGCYPRAAFGLPIVFHFKNPGDPPDAVLEPCRGDRMASPLILRPYFDGSAYRPLALLLPGWKKCVSVPVGFRSKREGPAWPQDPAERSRLADLIPPMHGRGSDALSAFMHYFAHERRGVPARGGR